MIVISAFAHSKRIADIHGRARGLASIRDVVDRNVRRQRHHHATRQHARARTILYMDRVQAKSHLQPDRRRRPDPQCARGLPAPAPMRRSSDCKSAPPRARDFNLDLIRGQVLRQDHLDATRQSQRRDFRGQPISHPPQSRKAHHAQHLDQLARTAGRRPRPIQYPPDLGRGKELPRLKHARATRSLQAIQTPSPIGRCASARPRPCAPAPRDRPARAPAIVPDARREDAAPSPIAGSRRRRPQSRSRYILRDLGKSIVRFRPGR